MKTKRLLVVDDALFMRKCIREIAEAAGWEIAGEAEDGEQALVMYQQINPDLVTLDIVMPKLDGVSTLKKLIQQDPRARVVMISAVNQKPKLIECIKAGAMDFIVKPFDKARLLEFFIKSLATDSQP
ncbi:response regulator [Novipirellula sp. SH528]|uniref:response regulator n=1 Tax=Novipirellula sp. SH528 TaxID=3454466 RepID=UPI003FA18BC0